MSEADEIESYIKCPFCNNYSVPKNFIKIVETKIDLPPKAIGITGYTDKVRFCTVCGKEFYKEKEDET